MLFSAKRLLTVCTTSVLLWAGAASATTVQIQTVLGDIEVNLFDKTTPKTVENFLTYVKSGAYTDSFIHRVVPGFIVQGGGFIYDTTKGKVATIDTQKPVKNEPIFSNRRGTIAMAKVSGDPNSATSQWFFNLADNSGNLDSQNGGFTVFGQVMGDGMDVVDAIAALQVVNAGGALNNLPVRSYDADQEDPIDETQLVMIQAVTVLDGAKDTADALEPAYSTYDGDSDSDKQDNNNGGGGSFGPFMLLLMLAGIGFSQYWKKR